MKTLRCVFFLSLLTSLFCSCDKREPSDPTLTISITDYWIGKDVDERVGIRFSVDTYWWANIHYADPQDRGWLYLTPGSGRAGEHSLTVTVTGANTTGAVRKAYVDIEYGSKLCRVTITQEG